ncbi:LacI family DNA-binding transcriptional regulator [Streptomyces radicis]|uniref:LacI family transcriptional regulator n=1 Tax=Streptomyces radicis TaxID=1750517 RepID=A0A3A9W571_9ACTN|nr:LacI family DNA-binding transcriptional regulator [Streptomyces radicis]RKN08385.1 LacI family transcriptional regulator [Streptomyces radicis]RKN21581.1 LacI family transcriptional regulator [Streptomyces radicis]
MSSLQARGPRQSDVAREAGVSQSTVSMVLGGAAERQRISPETRRRVLEAARKLRYSPTGAGRSAAAPRATRGLLLGVHTFEPVFPTSTGDYYFEFMRGIEEQAVAEACNLVLFTATQTEDGIRRIYDAEGVNALRHAVGSVLLGHHAGHGELARLARDGYPFVFIGRREVPDADIAYVGGDYRAATGRIVDQLVAQGHRRIAYLGEEKRDEPQTDRWEGFRAALTRFGLDVPEPAFTAPDALTTQWLDTALAAGTTAVLVESVNLVRVLAVMTGVRGVTIPRDLSVVLLVDDPGGPAEPHPWACLRVPRNAMGRRAVRLLVQLLGDPSGDHDRQVLLPCEHTLTGTVAPPPPGSTP